MENIRVKKRKQYKILCVLHELDFEHQENSIVHTFIIQSDQADCGLALLEVKEKVFEFNHELEKKYLLSIGGYYTGDKSVKTYTFDEFTMDLIKRKIKENR